MRGKGIISVRGGRTQDQLSVVSCVDSSDEVRGAQAATANSDSTRLMIAPTYILHAQPTDDGGQTTGHWFTLLVQDRVSLSLPAGNAELASPAPPPREAPPAERC